jgi:hypothetical protein
MAQDGRKSCFPANFAAAVAVMISLWSISIITVAREREPLGSAATKKVKRRELDGGVLEGVKHGLINANSLELFRREVEAEVAQATKTQGTERKQLQRDLAQVGKKLSNLATAIADGGAFETLKDSLMKYEAEKSELEAKLAETVLEVPQINLPANWEEAHRAEVERLETLLHESDLRDAAITAIQSLIEQVVLTPTEDGSGMKVKLEGALASLLVLSEAQEAGKPSKGSLRGLSLSVVAGTRNQRSLRLIQAMAPPIQTQLTRVTCS